MATTMRGRGEIRLLALASAFGQLFPPRIAVCAAPVEVSMARDHRRLRVFQKRALADTCDHKETRNFPRDEWFESSQVRRAAVSIASNLVEGSARRGGREHVHFVNVSCGSAAEVAYLITLVRTWISFCGSTGTPAGKVRSPRSQPSGWCRESNCWSKPKTNVGGKREQIEAWRRA